MLVYFCTPNELYGVEPDAGSVAASGLLAEAGIPSESAHSCRPTRFVAVCGAPSASSSSVTQVIAAVLLRPCLAVRGSVQFRLRLLRRSVRQVRGQDERRVHEADDRGALVVGDVDAEREE